MKPSSDKVVTVADIEGLISAHDTAPLAHLLEQIEDLETRSAALLSLHKLADHLSGMQQSPERLCVRIIDLPGSKRPIRLLMHPAVFTPEDWGRTFAEGLLKEPEEFRSKRIVELGTGSGWISILLLLRTGAAAVVGLDLNPIAVMCANLNLWLNGTTADGTLVNSQAGVPLIQAMRFAQSDLLGEPLESGEQFDYVIGCIPQVLHPELTEPELEKATTEDLYDLSNYCFRQGILEDRFGLPLIARALEEAQLCLAPGGKVTLILGGRPGPEAITSMFRRRGFEPKLIWSRRIPQADDTDLASLVKLERAHDLKFNFFVSRDSEQAVSADTAVKLLAAGQPIFHDLLVYRATTRFEKATFDFVRNVRAMRLDSLRRELDFSRMSDEQISYLSRLSADLMKSKTIPYPHERGDMSLRRKLSDFLSVYCHYDIAPENLFVSAERAQLIAMVLTLVTTGDAKILLSESLQYAYRSVIDNGAHEIIESNDDLSEIFVLDDLLNPDLLLISPVQLATPSAIVLQALATQARRHPERWYIIDDSAQFDICSDLNSNMLVRLLADYPMPSNVVLLYGLVKNTVQADLELSFMLNAPGNWLPALDVGAELTYSRIAYPSQHYYEWLFDDLLSFTFNQGKSDPPSMPSPIESFLPLPSLTCALEEDPVFRAKPIDPDGPYVIRLDYGEFEYPVPDMLVKGLFKGFLETGGGSLSQSMRERVSSYLRSTRNASVAPETVVLAQGVFPLFGALIGALKRKLGRPPRVAVPNGSYGPLFPLALYHGAELVAFDVTGTGGLTFSVCDFPGAGKNKPDLLWLTQPTNPTGMFIDSRAVHDLLTKCAEAGTYLLVDEIFFLLSDVRMGTWTSPQLSFLSHLGTPEAKYLFVADGVAKAFAAGGLRCGFLVCPDQAWADQIQSSVWIPPQSTLRAWDSVYSAFAEDSDPALENVQDKHREITAYLQGARTLLSQQRDALLALLRRFNLNDGAIGTSRGGLFVMAKLDSKAEALAKEEKVLVNPGAWCRMPGWTRLCIGLPEAKFAEALIRLERFLVRHYP